jgi:hypothetical protein
MKTEEELRTLKRIIENYRDADPKRFADDRLSIDWLWVLNWVLEGIESITKIMNWKKAI